LTEPKQTIDGVKEIGYGWMNTLSFNIPKSQVLKTCGSLFFFVSIFFLCGHGRGWGEGLRLHADYQITPRPYMAYWVHGYLE
jgi:hypothetical protein